MIITEEEQRKLLDTYFKEQKPKHTEGKALGFIAGVNAMMDLVDKKLTAEREALQPEQPQTKD